MLAPGDDADPLYLPRLLRRGRRETTKTPITTESEILRVSDIPVIAGTVLQISTSPVNLDATNVGNIGAIRMRYKQHTSPGSPATIADSTLQNYARQYQDDATNSNVVPFLGYLIITSDGYLSVLLTALMHTGTGSIQVFCSSTDKLDLMIFQMGPDPGDSGEIL